jgi:hypothetical protein
MVTPKPEGSTKGLSLLAASTHFCPKIGQSTTEVPLPAIRVTKADVTITLRAEENGIGPEENYDIPGIKQSNRDAKLFVDAVHEMTDKHGLWGWCQVTVTVRLGPLKGESHMGDCSYESDEDFIQNSGYYEDMVGKAIADLQKSIDATYALIHVD